MKTLQLQLPCCDG